MTSHLPAELERWPIAPRAILNVPSSADKAEIRRAYAQLIRHFRPETHPEHFQRIREAMEMLLAGLAGNGAAQGFSIGLPSELAHEQQGRPDFYPQPSARDMGQSVTASLLSPGGQSTSQLNVERDGIWDEYSQRPSAECLQKLHDLATSSELDPLPFLMGCWAARLTPELTPERRPFDWAREGIAQTGGSPELIEILLEELRDDITLVTEEASGQQAEQIKDIALAQAYLSARWRLMAQKGFWQRLTREFEATQKSFSYSRPDVWFQIVMRLFELCVLNPHADAQKLASTTREEIQALSSSRNSHQQSEYADVLIYIRHCYQNRFASGDDRLDSLVLDTNVLDADQFHLGVLRFVGRYIDLPARLLQILTELAMQVPEALWLLSTHPQAWGRSPDTADSKRDQALLRSVELMLRQSGQLPYGDFRKDIAEFCRYECINSAVLIDTLQQLHESRMMPVTDTILGQITRDLSLLLTCEWNWIFLHSCGPPKIE
jgi:hypothetical protein